MRREQTRATFPSPAGTRPASTSRLDFLKATTKSLLNSNLTDGAFISAKDKHVVVVGGGDTGNGLRGHLDPARARSRFTQIEMLPCPPESRLESNPWPEWPRVLKVDYGQQEAIALFGDDPRVYQTTIKEILKNEAGAVRAVKLVELTRDEKGRFVEVPGTEREIECDLLLIAAGFPGQPALRGRGVRGETQCSHQRGYRAGRLPDERPQAVRRGAT